MGSYQESTSQYQIQFINKKTNWYSLYISATILFYLDRNYSSNVTFYFAGYYLKVPHKNSVILVYNKYTYHKIKEFNHGKCHWRCSVQKRLKCRATVHTINDVIVKFHEKHNHEPIKKWTCNVFNKNFFLNIARFFLFPGI